MARRSIPDVSVADDVMAAMSDRLQAPLAIVLGAPGPVARLASQLSGDIVCYQMDLHTAGHLQDELRAGGSAARVATLPDLWDLPAEFRTVIYPAPKGGERGLKLDMVEQAYHILLPRGCLVVHTPYEADQFFPGQLKKVFGKVHQPAAGDNRVLWVQRHSDGARRRHEMTFHARVDEGPSLVFVSRPGTFSYGRFDDGARALVETMEIEPGDRILDIGCGCGTNGIVAARRAGPEGHVVLVDSNVRAVALAEENARRNAVTSFEAIASCTLDTLAPSSFDVVLANPPYYAQNAIAHLFIARGRRLLKPGGRFYLVTKQPDALGPLIVDTFGQAEIAERRGYFVLCAELPEE